MFSRARFDRSDEFTIDTNSSIRKKIDLYLENNSQEFNQTVFSELPKLHSPENFKMIKIYLSIIGVNINFDISTFPLIDPVSYIKNTFSFVFIYKESDIKAYNCNADKNKPRIYIVSQKTFVEVPATTTITKPMIERSVEGGLLTFNVDGDNIIPIPLPNIHLLTEFKKYEENQNYKLTPRIITTTDKKATIILKSEKSDLFLELSLPDELTNKAKNSIIQHFKDLIAEHFPDLAEKINFSKSDKSDHITTKSQNKEIQWDTFKPKVAGPLIFKDIFDFFNYWWLNSVLNQNFFLQFDKYIIQGDKALIPLEIVAVMYKLWYYVEQNPSNLRSRWREDIFGKESMLELISDVKINSLESIYQYCCHNHVAASSLVSSIYQLRTDCPLSKNSTKFEQINDFYIKLFYDKITYDEKIIQPQYKSIERSTFVVKSLSIMPDNTIHLMFVGPPIAYPSYQPIYNFSNGYSLKYIQQVSVYKAFEVDDNKMFIILENNDTKKLTLLFVRTDYDEYLPPRDRSGAIPIFELVKSNQIKQMEVDKKNKILKFSTRHNTSDSDIWHYYMGCSLKIVGYPTDYHLITEVEKTNDQKTSQSKKDEIQNFASKSIPNNSVNEIFYSFASSPRYWFDLSKVKADSGNILEKLKKNFPHMDLTKYFSQDRAVSLTFVDMQGQSGEAKLQLMTKLPFVKIKPGSAFVACKHQKENDFFLLNNPILYLSEPNNSSLLISAYTIFCTIPSANCVVYNLFDTDMFLDAFELFVQNFEKWNEIHNLYEYFLTSKEAMSNPPVVVFLAKFTSKLAFVERIKEIARKAKNSKIILYLMSYCILLDEDKTKYDKIIERLQIPSMTTERALSTIINSGVAYADMIIHLL